ncbi:hypothetical protein PC116_g14831 [Phytophthora cactorum]|uniref:Uncharacterized protein n=1 Tax=Phytophthora cactorum TaxID=29920 RepID=A0A8T1KPR0_9STRA|nr:hypothetical protein Pcac1_g1664 [Phytophthora cactorum]KAG2937449.1 hypothetical protein PC117_g11677 [Phytophthora cactorum]KAG3165619.1 hypothetical protein C6341_g12312 [Phytophthora cactorum]KAG4237095.1 hypothetical protein PC116_g14831 [Phytophthora cactorum]
MTLNGEVTMPASWPSWLRQSHAAALQHKLFTPSTVTRMTMAIGLGVLLTRGLLLSMDFELCYYWSLVATSCACAIASTYRASPRSSVSVSS